MADRTLPLDSKGRKNYPISDGCDAYFPAALAGVSYNSFMGGAKHTGGLLIHKRWLSTDHDNCIRRHQADIRDLRAQRARGVKRVQVYLFNLDTKVDELVEVSIEEAILLECNCLAWRSLALSQELHEQLGGAPLAPAALLKPEEPPAAPLLPTAVRVVSYPADRKVAFIKAVRLITGLSLKEAKDISEFSFPRWITVPGHFSNEEAKRLLIEAGATLRHEDL